MATQPERLELLVRLARRFKALGDPTRLQLLHALERGESCVGDLVTLVGGSQANVSKHLGVLRSVGLVKARRDGMNVNYSVDDVAVLEVCRLMCGTLERQVGRDLACIEQSAGSFAASASGAIGAPAPNENEEPGRRAAPRTPLRANQRRISG